MKRYNAIKANVNMEMTETNNRKPTTAEHSQIITAVEAGNSEALRLALEADPDGVNNCPPGGLSPLVLAVKQGSLPCVKLLVSKKADVNMSISTEGPALEEIDASTALSNEESLTPFLLACRLGHQSTVEFLFYNGADQRHITSKNRLNCLSLAIMYNRRETSKFLVTHTNQETLLFLMKTLSRDLKMGQRSGRMTTPMRQLIQYMPDVAEIVMDRCLTLSEEDEEVTLLLELLEDRFSPWARKNEEHLSGKPPHIFDNQGYLRNVSHIRRHGARLIQDQHPLDLMRKEDRHGNLLTHPLSIKLIEHKWRNLGIFLDITSLLIYCTFLALLTGYVLVNPPAFYIKFSNSTTIIWYSSTQDQLLPEGTFTEAASYFFGRDGAYLILVLVITNIFKEMFQIYSQRRKYFCFQTLMEWLIYILTFLLVIPVSGIQYGPYELREKWQWECGALAIFLAWINLALYVRQTLTFGIYVIMFEVVLRSTIQFMLVIFLFMVAFALAFNTLLLNQTDFHSFGDAILRTFAMSVGELDFTRIFHSQNYLGTENVEPEEDFILTAVFSDTITSITFVVFVITMPIIAMNLLVGVAVEDIHRIRQKARFYYLKLKVDHIIAAENLVLGTFLRYFLVGRIPITKQYLKMRLSQVPSVRARLTSIVYFEDVRDSVRAVCQRNQEREEIRAQKSPSGRVDPPADVPTQSLLQKLRNMQNEIDHLIKHMEQ